MLRIIRYTLAATTILFAASTAQASSHQCAKLKKMRLVIDEYKLVLDSKKPICTKVPNTFTIKIKNPDDSDHVISKGDVTVTQKEGSPLTITGNNNDDRLKLKVTVSGTTSTGSDALFLIKVKDVGILDPRVRVVDTDMLREILTHDLADLLDVLGLGWDDALRVATKQLESQE